MVYLHSRQDEKHSTDKKELHVCRQIPRPRKAHLAPRIKVVDVQQIPPPKLRTNHVHLFAWL